MHHTAAHMQCSPFAYLTVSFFGHYESKVFLMEVLQSVLLYRFAFC